MLQACTTSWCVSATGSFLRNPFARGGPHRRPLAGFGRDATVERLPTGAKRPPAGFPDDRAKLLDKQAFSHDLAQKGMLLLSNSRLAARLAIELANRSPRSQGPSVGAPQQSTQAQRRSRPSASANRNAF